MAIYTYICLDCGAFFDVQKPMKDAQRPEFCAECESSTTERRYGTPAIFIK